MQIPMLRHFFSHGNCTNNTQGCIRFKIALVTSSRRGRRSGCRVDVTDDGALVCKKMPCWKSILWRKKTDCVSGWNSSCEAEAGGDALRYADNLRFCKDDFVCSAVVMEI